jgi:hypothetical protein
VVNPSASDDQLRRYVFRAVLWKVSHLRFLLVSDCAGDKMLSTSLLHRTFSLFEPELKDALQRLAWLPSRGVKLDLLARVVKSQIDQLKQCLKPAVDSTVIRISNGEVAFSHDRHHLAVLASIPEATKPVLFLSIAEALEGVPSPELIFVRADLLLAAHSLESSSVPIQVLCRARKRRRSRNPSIT